MPTSGDSLVLLDTSAAVPFLVVSATGHADTYAALHQRRLGLAGHAVFETFSVLTRMPRPHRVSPNLATHLIGSNFPATVGLSGSDGVRMLGTLADAGVSGGAVYDGLVALTALEHQALLVTRDRRASDTYRALGVRVELLS